MLQAFAIIILFSNLIYLIDIMATVLLVSGLGLPYTITKLQDKTRQDKTFIIKISPVQFLGTQLAEKR